MGDEKINYIPFLALPAEWAIAAGMPKEMVLRRLCEWAVVGAFPPGAFVTLTGDQVDPFDIYMSFRAAETAHGTINLGGYTMHDSRWGLGLLMSALVTAQGV